MRPILLIPLLLAMVGGGWFLFSGSTGNSPDSKKGGRESPPVAVVVAKAQRESVPLEVRTIGAVHPLTSVAVRTRVDGEILQVHFKEGEMVKSDQLLFTLDQRTPQALLSQAEAQLARDQASLANARRERTRYRELVGKGAASAQKLEEVSTQTLMAEALVKVAEAAVESARLHLGHTRIVAPMAGRSGAIRLPQGNMARVADAEPLVTLHQLDPIQVSFSVPQQVLPAARALMTREGFPVTLVLPGAAEYSPAGTLDFIDNAVDAATGTLPLKASFPNADGVLWPGQRVEVTLRLGEEADAVTLPIQAVQYSQKGSFVFIVTEQQTAEKREVTVRRTRKGVAVIDKGLEGGETVVVDGQFRLMPGGKVALPGDKPKGAPASGAGKP